MIFKIGTQHLKLHPVRDSTLARTALGLGADFAIRDFGPTTRMGRFLPMSGAGYLLMFLEFEKHGRTSK